MSSRSGRPISRRHARSRRKQAQAVPSTRAPTASSLVSREGAASHPGPDSARRLGRPAGRHPSRSLTGLQDREIACRFRASTAAAASFVHPNLLLGFCPRPVVPVPAAGQAGGRAHRQLLVARLPDSITAARVKRRGLGPRRARRGLPRLPSIVVNLNNHRAARSQCDGLRGRRVSGDFPLARGRSERRVRGDGRRVWLGRRR